MCFTFSKLRLATRALPSSFATCPSPIGHLHGPAVVAHRLVLLSNALRTFPSSAALRPAHRERLAKLAVLADAHVTLIFLFIGYAVGALPASTPLRPLLRVGHVLLAVLADVHVDVFLLLLILDAVRALPPSAALQPALGVWLVLLAVAALVHVRPLLLFQAVWAFPSTVALQPLLGEKLGSLAVFAEPESRHRQHGFERRVLVNLKAASRLSLCGRAHKFHKKLVANQNKNNVIPARELEQWDWVPFREHQGASGEHLGGIWRACGAKGAQKG